MCPAISENICYRWFCFLTIDDPVFDHSTITYFINRIGREGFSEVFHGLNQELLRMGLLAPELYVDSSLVKANVSSYGLTSSGMTVEEFRQQAIEENGLFTVTGTTVDGDGVEHEQVRYFQSPEGRLPLNPVDTDARWRTSRPGKLSGLHYQENVIVDLGGLIVARGVTHASQGEWKAVPDLLDQLPMEPVSLAGDTGYNAGQLRELLEERDIKAYIPIHPIQENNMVAKGGFTFRGDHLVCPQSKTLPRTNFHRKNLALPICGPSEGLPSLPGEGGLPPARTEAAIYQPHDVLPSLPAGQREEPDFRVPAGALPASHHRGRNLRLAGPAQLGAIPAPRVVEGGL